MKKYNVLIENDLVDGGGVERVLYYLATYLLKRNYRVTIVTSIGTKEEFYSIFPKKIKYLSRQNVNADACARFSKEWFVLEYKLLKNRFMKQTLKRKHYDIAIAIKEGIVAKNVSLIRAKQRYAWVHTDYMSFHWTRSAFSSNEEERKLFQSFDKVLCVSQAAANSVKTVIGDPGNLLVRYNPIPVKQILQDANKPCEYRRNPEKPLFVSVGRLDKIKQYSLLIDVCQKMSYSYDFELWIVGDGPERSRLEMQIKQNGITCVKLLGKQENPHAITKQADCFISTSASESYGLALQEALALGVPVLAVSCPAIVECIDSRFGWIVNNNMGAVQHAIEQLLKYPEKLKQVRCTIEKVFEVESLWEDRLQAICDIWEKNGEQ